MSSSDGLAAAAAHWTYGPGRPPPAINRSEPQALAKATSEAVGTKSRSLFRAERSSATASFTNAHRLELDEPSMRKTFAQHNGFVTIDRPTRK